MKTRVYILIQLLCAASLLLTSCDKGEEIIDGNGYEEYSCVLYLKDSGEKTLDFVRKGTDVVYNTAIHKGGIDTKATANAELKVFTAEEIEAYNKTCNTDYQLLPDEYYELSQTTYEFGMQDISKAVSIILKKEIDIDIDVDQNNYVLPLKLTSSDGAVNNEVATLVLRLNITSFKLELGKTGIQPKIRLSGSENNATFTLPVKLNAENEGWTFDAVFEADTDKLAAVIEEYNAENSESEGEYELLPAGHYRFDDKISFAGNETMKEFSVSLERKNLEIGIYMLPIILKGAEGMMLETDEDAICFIQVEVYESMPQITLIPEQLSASNEAGGFSVARLIDGDLSFNTGLWQSAWSPLPVPDPQYGIYIDIKNVSGIDKYMELELFRSASDPEHNEAGEIHIYVGADENNLKCIKKLRNINYDDNHLATTGLMVSGKPDMIRLAIVKNCKGVSLTEQSGNTDWSIPKNVSLAEIKLYGK